MEIILILGAGASFGSKDIKPYPPPLSTELFSRLKSSFPSSWGSIPQHIQSKLEENFEDGMNIIWTRYSSSISFLMQEMGIYFAQFTPGKYNLYIELLRNLKDKRLLTNSLISTINYDCLLEIAASKIGLVTNYFSDQEGSNLVNILKLHGSCNFVSSSFKATRNISFSRGIVFSGGIKVVQPNQVISMLRGNTSLPPVMSIFAKGKPLQISPHKIQELQDLWKKNILNAKKVFIVGVNPNLEDKHIWDPLSETDAAIYYIGNEKRFNEYSESYRLDKQNNFISNRFDKGFKQLFDNLH